MCNKQRFRSVQHMFLFYVHEENAVRLRNTGLRYSLPSVRRYTCEHPQNVKNMLLGVRRNRSCQKVLFFSFLLASAMTCCEVLQPHLLYYFHVNLFS